jgi:predicted RNA-binding protein
MCLAEAWIRENGEEELVMEGIAIMKIENEKLVLNSIFGEQKEIEAHVKGINFLHHSITLGRTQPVGTTK